MKLLIINGSPRGKRSNSRKYGELLEKVSKSPIDTTYVMKNNKKELCKQIEEYTDVVIMFPLYADGIPTHLLEFLIVLEESSLTRKPKIHILINCGFLEPKQNDTCIKMMKYFCKKNGFTFGSVLSIGSGEAIMNTPFKVVVQRKMKSFLWSIKESTIKNYKVTMPLTKVMFVKASTMYWINYGKNFNTSKESMQNMIVEGKV